MVTVFYSLLLGGSVLIGSGGILYLVALWHPSLGRRVYRTTWPAGMRDPIRRRLSYLNEGVFAAVLLCCGAVFGLVAFSGLQEQWGAEPIGIDAMPIAFVWVFPALTAAGLVLRQLLKHRP